MEMRKTMVAVEMAMKLLHFFASVKVWGSVACILMLTHSTSSLNCYRSRFNCDAIMKLIITRCRPLSFHNWWQFKLFTMTFMLSCVCLTNEMICVLITSAWITCFTCERRYGGNKLIDKHKWRIIMWKDFFFLRWWGINLKFACIF